MQNSKNCAAIYISLQINRDIMSSPCGLFFHKKDYNGISVQCALYLKYACSNRLSPIRISVKITLDKFLYLIHNEYVI